MLPVLTESLVCPKAQSRVWHIQGMFRGAAHPAGAGTPLMGYRGFSSLSFAYAFVIQMLSSVNISSVWLHTERWISLCSVCEAVPWSSVRGLWQCLCDTSGSPAAVTEGTTCVLSHCDLQPPVSCHFTSLLSLCQEKLPFVSQVWQAQLGKRYRERFGSFFLLPAGRRYRMTNSGRGMSWMSKNPVIKD